MTLSTETVRVSYAGNGSTTVFPITFVFWDDSDILAVLRSSSGGETTWVDGVHYSLSGGDGSTGTLTATVAPASGTTLVITSDRPLTQPHAFPLGGAFPSTAAEQSDDQLVRLVQQMSRDVARSMKFPLTDSTSLSTDIPSSVSRAGAYLAFDADGAVTAASGTGSDPALRTDLSTSSNLVMGDALVALKRNLTGSTATSLHAWHEAQPLHSVEYALVADGTTDNAGLLTLMMAAAAARGGGIVRLGVGTFYFTGTLTVPAGVRLCGEGATEVSASETEDSTSPTVLKANVTGTTPALVLSSGARISGFKLMNSQAGIAGRGIQADDVYFWKAENVYVEGFMYGWYGTKLLYVTMTDCRGTAGTNGLFFTGANGTWNVSWYNNLIVMTNCHFNGNTTSGCRIKGMNAILVGCDASKVADSYVTPTAGRGFYFEGDTTIPFKGSVTIISPYVETTWMPYTFRRCNATIIDGFVQGWGSAPANTAVIDADESTVTLVGRMRNQNLFANRVLLTNNSTVFSDEAFATASTDSIDATSKYLVRDYDAGTFTAGLTGLTTSPTVTAYYVRNGKSVTITVPQNTGVGNNIAITLTGLPAALYPARSQIVYGAFINSGAESNGCVLIQSSGTVNLYPLLFGGNWAAAGTSGHRNLTLSYNLL